MKHMILSLFFMACAMLVFFPGARAVVADRYFVSSLTVKIVAAALMFVAGLFFVLGSTAG